MPDKDNAAQEVVDDLFTDPDKDAGSALPPQTVEAEPTSDRPASTPCPTTTRTTGPRL